MKHITLNKKLEILKLLNEGESFNKVAKRMILSRSTIYTIQRNKPSIINFYKGANVPEIIRKFKRMRQPNSPVMEKELYSWFVEMRNNNTSITDETVLVTANAMLNKDCSSDNIECGYSQEWLKNFKNRNGIKSYKLCDESVVETPMSICIEIF
ncbi:hypothetical protein A3Q56_08626 [Intoshia linei]|uniref:HTH CENPB-type domain-containing protein n=1 Tax=Intoshia linei TaxID=1819745 RepID=A0A177ANP6_9BILA|nr:hypothetical protein A3Q56_08626 [Intoshia linei]